MITIKDLTINYGKFIAVNNVSFKIKDGEFVSIVGQSGCGKTTILRGIMGFEHILKGDVLINNNSIIKLPIEDRKIGYIFQNYTLFPNMNVFENIAFGLKNMKYPKDKIKKMVNDIATSLKIDNILEKRVDEISGGQQQRVAIARSLVLKPSILLLDEPFSNLDEALRENLIEEIYRINKESKITIIYVAHDLKEILSYSDKILVMKDGTIEQYAPPEEIYNNPKTNYVIEFIGNKNILNEDILKNIDEKYNYYINYEKIKLVKSKNGKFVINKVLFCGFYYLIKCSDKKGNVIKVISLDMFNINDKVNISFNDMDVIKVEKKR